MEIRRERDPKPVGTTQRARDVNIVMVDRDGGGDTQSLGQSGGPRRRCQDVLRALPQLPPDRIVADRIVLCFVVDP